MNEKKIIIRIFGYHIVIFLALFLIIGIGSLLLLEIVLDIQKDGLNAISKILVILVSYFGIVMFFMNIVKLASKKILLFEDYFVIDDIEIKYKDIIGINLVQKNYNISGGYLNMGKRYSNTVSKENYLKIILSNGISYEYFVGQFSINNIEKIIKHIESKTNCNFYDVYQKIDEQKKLTKKDILIIIIGIVFLFFVIFVVPNIYSYLTNMK